MSRGQTIVGNICPSDHGKKLGPVSAGQSQNTEAAILTVAHQTPLTFRPHPPLGSALQNLPHPAQSFSSQEGHGDRQGICCH